MFVETFVLMILLAALFGFIAAIRKDRRFLVAMGGVILLLGGMVWMSGELLVHTGWAGSVFFPIAEQVTNQFDRVESTQMKTEFAISSDFNFSSIRQEWNFSGSTGYSFTGSSYDVDTGPGEGEWFIESRQLAHYNPGDNSETGVAFCIDPDTVNGTEYFEAGLIGDENRVVAGVNASGEYVKVVNDGETVYAEMIDAGFEDCVIGQIDYSLYGAGEIVFEFLEYRASGPGGDRELVERARYARSGDTTVSRFNLPIRTEGNLSAGDDGYMARVLSMKYEVPIGSNPPERVQTARVGSVSVTDSVWKEVATFRKDLESAAVFLRAVEIAEIPADCTVYVQTRVETVPRPDPVFGEFTFHQVEDRENAVEVSTVSDNVTLSNGNLSGTNTGGLGVFDAAGKKNEVGGAEERFGVPFGDDMTSVLFKAAPGDSCTVSEVLIETDQRY